MQPGDQFDREVSMPFPFEKRRPTDYISTLGLFLPADSLSSP
jgi:hypothetical protein